MDVHHILPFKICKNTDGTQNYDIPNIYANLVSLCSKCHKKTEIELVSFIKSLPTEHKKYVSSAKFFNNFYHSPNSIPQQTQELILKSAPQNVRAAFINTLPIIKLNAY